MEARDVGAEIVDGVERAGQYGIRVDDEVVTLLSLPPGAFAEIQDRTGTRWMNILLDPIGRIDIATDLVKAAYKKVGKKPPKLDEAAGIVRLFVELPGDLPDPVKAKGGGSNPTDAT